MTQDFISTPTNLNNYDRTNDPCGHRAGNQEQANGLTERIDRTSLNAFSGANNQINRTIMTERILFKKGRRIICYIDIMPEKIEVKTGKPSDATCISWKYQPNELERAKATATEFFDNVTRI